MSPDSPILDPLPLDVLSPPHTSSSPHPSKAWHGQLHLDFTHRHPKTHLSHSFARSPFKVQRPFYPEGDGVCHVVMLHTAGGIVGGDRLSSHIQVQPDAQALLTTAAATKVYRSNGQTATQSVQVQVQHGGCLEWLPQETIVFNGARIQQQMRVDLADQALWMGWEMVRLGRTARGEQFSTGCWRSHTEVWQGDRLLWLDPQQLEGGSAMMTSAHGLAGCPVVASFAVVGREISPELVHAARSLWSPMGTPSGSSQGDRTLSQTASQSVSPIIGSAPELTTKPAGPLTPATVGVTRLMAGMLCRYRGHSTAEARRWLTAVWGLMRQELVGRSPCPPRVW